MNGEEVGGGGGEGREKGRGGERRLISALFEKHC